MSSSSIFTRGLSGLLARARAQGAPADICQRLEWFVYFQECKSISKTCSHFGIARTTFYRWAHRFDPEDILTLSDQPKHPERTLQSRSKVKKNLNALLSVSEDNLEEQVQEPPLTQSASSQKSVLDYTLRDLLTHAAFIRLAFFFVAVGVLSMISNIVVMAFLLSPAKADAQERTLVNTESFTIIDEGDGTTDIVVQFGAILSESLTFDRSLDRFRLSNDLTVSGSLLVDQNNTNGTGLIIDSESTSAPLLALDGAATDDSAPHITFGHDGEYDVSLYRSGSGALTIENSLSGSDNVFTIVTDNGGTDNTVFRVSNDGNVFADGSFTPSGADLAEVYYADEGIAPGSLVALDPQAAGFVLPSTLPYQSGLMGVVSTDPGILLRESENNPGEPIEVALVGRVPVRVSIENGMITAGDYLTSSHVAGVAMKATEPGTVVAQALEDYDGDGEGTIMALLKSTYIFGDALALWQDAMQVDRPLFVEGPVTAESFMLESGAAGLAADGTLITKEIVAGEAFSGAGLVDCDAPNMKLVYDVRTRQFGCQIDQVSSGLSAYAHIYDEHGGQSLNSTTTISLSSVAIAHSSFFDLENDGTITILTAGDYEVNYQLAIESQSSKQSTTRAWLEQSYFRSFNPVPASSCWSQSDSKASCAGAAIIRLQEGDQLRLRALDLDGGSSKTIPNESAIMLKRIEQDTRVSQQH